MTTSTKPTLIVQTTCLLALIMRQTRIDNLLARLDYDANMYRQLARSRALIMMLTRTLLARLDYMSFFFLTRG